MKGGKGKAYSSTAGTSASKQTDNLDLLTCDTCKQAFVDEDIKVLSCDRCEIWYCI